MADIPVFNEVPSSRTPLLAALDTKLGTPYVKLTPRQKLVRLRVRAQLRWYRRVARSQHLWECYQRHYGRQPGLSSQLWIHDYWTGTRRKWSYERALALEQEAYILYNRLRNVRERAVPVAVVGAKVEVTGKSDQV
jgi:hypothetical protein